MTKVQKTHVCLPGFVVTSIHPGRPGGCVVRIRGGQRRNIQPSQRIRCHSSFRDALSPVQPQPPLRQSFKNLKPDGYLALETQVYDHPQDPNICYFMHMQNNDPSNFWALSTPVSKKNLELIGLSDAREVKKLALSKGRRRICGTPNEDAFNTACRTAYLRKAS